MIATDMIRDMGAANQTEQKKGIGQGRVTIGRIGIPAQRWGKEYGSDKFQDEYFDRPTCSAYKSQYEARGR
jgi:hypothetical protein